jgi:hypothetical protein
MRGRLTLDPSKALAVMKRQRSRVKVVRRCAEKILPRNIPKNQTPLHRRGA